MSDEGLLSMLRLTLLAGRAGSHRNIDVFVDVWLVYRFPHVSSRLPIPKCASWSWPRVSSHCITNHHLSLFEDSAISDANLVTVGAVLTKVLWQILDHVRPSAVDHLLESSQYAVSGRQLSKLSTFVDTKVN